MKILIANPFGIGDVLFTTPIISNIKHQLRNAKIGYLCNRRVAPLLEQDPRIYKFFVYEKDEFRGLWQQSKCKCLEEIRHLFSDIKSEKFDCVLDFSLAGEFAFTFWLMGIKKRVGFNYKNRAKFLNKKIPLYGFNDKHVIEYYLDLLKFLGVKPEDRSMKIFISDTERKKAEDLLKISDISKQDNTIAVMPGGGASWGKDSHRRHYPADRFAAACDKLIKEQGVKIIILGDLKEKKLVDKVVNNMNEKPSLVTTALPLREFMAVLSQCKLLFCNDGGPLHIAVGLGIPCVSILGPVDEKVYGPYPPDKKHRVMVADVKCRPCYKNFKLPECKNRRCLQDLQPEEVFDACKEQLKR